MAIRVAATGAKRDDRAGKGRYDLLPPLGVKAVALRFELGAERYGDRNWEKGQPLGWFIDSAMRHGFREMAGDTDEDHAAAAAWNWLCYLETKMKLNAGTATGSSSAGHPPATGSAGTRKNTAGRPTRRAKRSRRQ